MIVFVEDLSRKECGRLLFKKIKFLVGLTWSPTEAKGPFYNCGVKLERSPYSLIESLAMPLHESEEQLMMVTNAILTRGRMIH